MSDNADATRALLARASEDLLEGRVPGPLTALRLVDLAGVKRHRLTHDNPDINAHFQRRAKEINRSRPEIDSLRGRLADEKTRNSRLVIEREDLRKTVKAYAETIRGLLDERALLLESLGVGSKVTPIRRNT